MKRVKDVTGRFSLRPHYDPTELDLMCEAWISDFSKKLHGSLVLPVPTDDLEKLIERDAKDLDLYAELSHEGVDVEGVTYFEPNGKPKVCISRELSNDDSRSHRLRTTLSHEYGHVRLHAPLWNTSATQQSLFVEAVDTTHQTCHRTSILGKATLDWMEWQAGYVCGALLMPISTLRTHVQSFFQRYNLPSRIEQNTRDAVVLQRRIAQLFDVSREAARVRLAKLGYLADGHLGTPLIY